MKITFYFLIGLLILACQTIDHNPTKVEKESLVKKPAIKIPATKTTPIKYSNFFTLNKQTVHIVEIDSKINSLRILQGKNQGLEKLSSMIGPQTLAAINGSFFSSNGKASGALKIAGRWHSKPYKTRGVFGWRQKVGKIEFYFDRLSSEGKSLVSHLEENQWFLEAQNIISGAPLLLYQGKKLLTENESILKSFRERAYGRSAICLKKDLRTLALILVEGGDTHTYKLGLRSGLNLSELSDLLLDQGCYSALNLDGGYSSSLMFKGRLIRSFYFSIFPERKISNILAVY